MSGSLLTTLGLAADDDDDEEDDHEDDQRKSAVSSEKGLRGGDILSPLVFFFFFTFFSWYQRPLSPPPFVRRGRNDERRRKRRRSLLLFFFAKLAPTFSSFVALTSFTSSGPRTRMAGTERTPQLAESPPHLGTTIFFFPNFSSSCLGREGERKKGKKQSAVLYFPFPVGSLVRYCYSSSLLPSLFPPSSLPFRSPLARVAAFT